MKKYRKALSKSATVTVQDVLAAAGGSVLSLGLNGLVAKATASMDDGMRQTVSKALPVAKVLVGGYAALESKNRLIQFGGFGMAGTGAIEAAIKFAPNYFSISGTDGDELFNMLGSADPSLLIELDPGDASLEEEGVLGTYDEVEEMAVL